MRILLIENDKTIGEFLKSSLESECFVVDWAKKAKDGAYLGRLNEYEIIILDTNISDLRGRDVYQKIRDKKKSVPIMILSDMPEIDAKIEFFDAGADDYLIKPFSFQELMARIKVILRRPKRQVKDDILEAGDIHINIKNHSVEKGGRIIYLTRKEFMLLELLVRKKGEIISRATMLENVWDMDADPFSNTIETHINSLRKKIGKEVIKTVPGSGYKVNI